VTIERVLADTNVVSWLGSRRGRHAEWAAVLTGRQAFVSFVTVGEILRGGIKAGWSEPNTSEWERRLRAYTVIPGTVVVAREYARIGARYFRQLSDNDLWIAATALAWDLPIATGDQRLADVAGAFGISLITA
jgi:predicted nucleic acid-binding protein